VFSANQQCWPAQSDMEAKIVAAFQKEGVEVIRGHPYDEKLKHGFIYNQRMGMDVFQKIPSEAPVIVAEAVWQYRFAFLVFFHLISEAKQLINSFETNTSVC